MAYKQKWGLSRNSKDSIAAVKAWKIDTENYRKRKFRGNNPKLGPITPEENERERISEQSTKYYDTEEQRLKLIPTDDAEIQAIIAAIVTRERYIATLNKERDTLLELAKTM